MILIVADASVLVEYLLRTDRAEAIGGIVEDPDVDLHVPALCDVEVVAALRRALLSGRMSVERAERAVEDYLDLPLVRHGHERLLAAILRLRSNFSAYDAAYVALAVGLGAALITGDRRLDRVVRRHTKLMTL